MNQKMYLKSLFFFFQKFVGNVPGQISWKISEKTQAEIPKGTIGGNSGRSKHTETFGRIHKQFSVQISAGI